MPNMHWDDLRFVLAVADEGTLLAAARRLKVDHTTVGRRVRSAEHALGVRIFARSRGGYVLTAEGERLLASLRGVERAVHAVERDAHAQQDDLSGVVRVTSPETFGAHYLAQRLGFVQQRYPGLVIELVPAGEVMDLAKREAEIGIRTFRSQEEGLVVRKAATVHYGLYASVAYLDRRPVGRAPDLSAHPILSIPSRSNEVEQRWLTALAPGVEPAFVSPVSSALREAAKSGAGLAILPCYLGDTEPTLRRIPVPDPPSDTLWLTVHRDLRKTPRVRAVLDELIACLEADAPLFAGA